MPSLKTVRNIPIAALLPDETDALNDELITLVSRISTTHVPVFAGLDAEWSIPSPISIQHSLPPKVQ